MKTITLQPWQLAALRAGLLKSVWVPLDDTTARLWPVATLPYGVGDVVELVGNCENIRHLQPCGLYGKFRLTAVTIRRVETITEQEMLDAGAANHTLGGSLWPVWDARYRTDHPDAGQWAVKVDLEAQT